MNITYPCDEVYSLRYPSRASILAIRQATDIRSLRERAAFDRKDLVRIPSEDQEIIHAVGFHEIL